MTTTTETEPHLDAWEQQRVPGSWAIVELMGHRVRAGSLSDITIGGATLLRIQHPTVADHDGQEPLTECYSPSALFSIRPCSREQATQWAEARWQRNTPTPALGELTAVADSDLWTDTDDSYIDDDVYGAQ